jgi:hypothetical protein
MPPRFAYWTILIDNAPTAFRAREREELLPTLHQLQRKNPDVVLKWFARGRLWESPEAERAAQYAPVSPRERRGADWRPGGAHKDPRDRFKKKGRDEKKRAWAAKPDGPPRPPRPGPRPRTDGGAPRPLPRTDGGSSRPLPRAGGGSSRPLPRADGSSTRPPRAPARPLRTAPRTTPRPAPRRPQRPPPRGPRGPRGPKR